MGTSERTKVGMFPLAGSVFHTEPASLLPFFVSPPYQLLPALLILNTQTCIWHEARTAGRLNEASTMKPVDGVNVCKWQHSM